MESEQRQLTLGNLKTVLDTSAMLAFLADTEGAAEVEHLLSSSRCYMHALSVAEVHCRIARSAGPDKAEEFVNWLKDEAGVAIREDMDAKLWMRASEIMADLGHLSITSCCCASLAAKLGAAVVTANHAEFGPIAQKGYCDPVLFIR